MLLVDVVTLADVVVPVLDDVLDTVVGIVEVMGDVWVVGDIQIRSLVRVGGATSTSSPTQSDIAAQTRLRTPSH